MADTEASLGDIPIVGAPWPEVDSRAAFLRMRVRALAAEWRRRADVAGPQAYAFTYRQCADELERLLDG